MDKDMVLSVVNDSMQFLKEDNPVQDVWYRGIDNGGYFMLINNSSGKALTAKSKNRLTIEVPYNPDQVKLIMGMMGLAGFAHSCMVVSTFSRAQRQVLDMGFADDINTY